METYKITWTPSPSTFVQSHDLLLVIDGVSAPAITLQAFEIEKTVDIPTGATVQVTVKTYGDNGTTALCPPLNFDAVNMEPVKPVGGLTATWVKHTP